MDLDETMKEVLRCMVFNEDQTLESLLLTLKDHSSVEDIVEAINALEMMGLIEHETHFVVEHYKLTPSGSMVAAAIYE
jgi:hypothetical protein